MPESEWPDSDPTDELGDEREERPSRSARKRTAEAAQRLGERLLTLRQADLAALELPESLMDAIQAARQMSNRGALARQRQYIGKLMRDIDPAPIERAIEALTYRVTRG